MPSLSEFQDFVALNIGEFRKGVWDYIGLAQLYPQLEVLGQLIPRKQTQDNVECTIVYQKETTSTGHGAKPGDPIQPISQADIIRRKVKMVKYVDSIGWVRDQGDLLGKSDEHIIQYIQKDLVKFDLHWWQDLEHMMLQMPTNIVPADNETLYGPFGAWVTDDASTTSNGYSQYGGDDPYAAGRPGSLSVATYSKYTNPVGQFDAVTDDDFFDKIERFLINRKLMGAVPNPRLLPDTPNDVCYTQDPLQRAIQRYFQASNSDTGMDAGRYRGQPTYKNVPFVVWHALGHVDSPVRPSQCTALLFDWNSFNYYVHSQYDRKIEGPLDAPYIPGGKYIQSEVWHQITCDRPDRNLYLKSDTAELQP